MSSPRLSAIRAQATPRRVGAVSALIVGSVVGVAAFTGGASSTLPHDELLPHVHDMLHEAGFADPTTTTTEAPTTTAEPTTEPPTTTGAPTSTAGPTTTVSPTTTGRVRPTTTTAAPTTTTVPPTTTTTVPPIPPPVHAGIDFTIMNANFATGERWWDARYHRDLGNGAGWDDGDRAGYKCAHMHLVYPLDSDPSDNPSVARVLFTRITAAGGYAGINDRQMAEGSRHFDGTPIFPLTNEFQIECPAADAEYVPLVDPVDQRPVISFVTAGGVLEERNYPLIEAYNIIFQQGDKIEGPFTVTDGAGNTSTVYDRIPVIAYSQIEGEWVPVIAVYYDSLSPEVSVVSDLP